MYAYAGTQNKMSTRPTQTQIQAHFDLAHAFKFSVETNFENCHRLSQLLRYTLVLLLFLLYLLYILHCLLFHIYTHTQGNNCQASIWTATPWRHKHSRALTLLCGWVVSSSKRKKKYSAAQYCRVHAMLWGFPLTTVSFRNRAATVSTVVSAAMLHRGKVVNVKAAQLSFYSR